jgi:hypothetical protein
MAAEHDITIYIGRDFVLDLEFQLSQKRVFSLVDYVVTFTVKNALGDTDAVAVWKDSAPTGTPAYGKAVFTIPHTSTSAFVANENGVYDVVLKSATDRISTVLSGKASITQSVRRTIP